MNRVRFKEARGGTCEWGPQPKPSTSDLLGRMCVCCKTAQKSFSLLHTTLRDFFPLLDVSLGRCFPLPRAEAQGSAAPTADYTRPRQWQHTMQIPTAKGPHGSQGEPPPRPPLSSRCQGTPPPRPSFGTTGRRRGSRRRGLRGCRCLKSPWADWTWHSKGGQRPRAFLHGVLVWQRDLRLSSR